MEEGHWWQEHEVTGHILSKVRKQREMDAGLAFSFFLSFIQSETSAPGMVWPTSSVSLQLSSLHTPSQTHPETCSLGDSRYIRLGMAANYHKIPVNRDEYATGKARYIHSDL